MIDDEHLLVTFNEQSYISRVILVLSDSDATAYPMLKYSNKGLSDKIGMFWLICLILSDISIYITCIKWQLVYILF